MTRDLAACVDEVARAKAELEALVRSLVPSDDVDEHQTAANELAWGVARAEAALATVAWAEGCGDVLASDIAAAASAEAIVAIMGASAAVRIRDAALLESIGARALELQEFGATEEEQLMRQSFRSFASERIAPLAGDLHRRDLDIPEQLIRDLADLGVFGLAVPEEYGGLHSDHDSQAMLIVTEELSRASLAVGSLGTRPEILVRALLRGGTEEQKQRWLPGIASGALMVAVATTEPDFGSDVANLQCWARRVDRGWEVTGTKLWCTFAGRAELLMLLLRTAEQGHRGLSLFVAEKPAYSAREFRYVQPDGGSLEGRAIPTIGYRGMHTFELAFDRFLLPEDSLVGGEEWLNRGFYLQMEGFSTGRLQTAARAVGLMHAAVEDTTSYISQRIVFGRPIAELGLPRAVLGRMIVRMVAARQLNHRAALLLSKGGGQMEASVAKLYASRMAEDVTRDAMQLHGGMGYAEETSVSRYFVDARVLSIFEGAEEVLALRVIAKTLLRDLQGASAK